MDDYTRKSWEKALNAKTMATNLRRASLYITAFELLKSVLIENPKGFVDLGFDPNAADAPFKQMGCLDQAELKQIRAIRDHRNEIAHELPKFLMDANHEVNQQLFDSIHFYICKIEVH